MSGRFSRDRKPFRSVPHAGLAGMLTVVSLGGFVHSYDKISGKYGELDFDEYAWWHYVYQFSPWAIFIFAVATGLFMASKK